MPKITIHRQHETEQLNYETGHSLLHILLGNQEDIPAPCGGKGSCGKCRVRVKDIGYVTSCIYYPDDDLEVFVPRLGESKVLTDQHHYSLNLDVEPGNLASLVDEPYGVAVDIGTTSIALYLIDLKNGHVLGTQGKANSQGKYGADVISRINNASQEGVLEELQNLVVEDIMDAIGELCMSFGLSPDKIVKLSVAANTTMLHLLMRVDPTSIALAPFTPSFTDEQRVNNRDLGFYHIHPACEVHLLPSISAYVGADIVAGMASLKVPVQVQNYLFIDVGTNGEMALVTPEKIWCTATAAGPAFEGANISCGMGAYPGAISVYKADSMLTINNEKAVGLCGSGLIDVVAYLLESGMLGMDGLLSEDFVIAHEEASASGEKVVLTPQDIREVQLAKSAIYTGIQTLMTMAGKDYTQVDALYLAGGLGNYLDIDSAIRIGLLPQEMKGKIIQLGNTSGAGAVLDVCSTSFTDIMNAFIAKSEAVDLASDPNFEMNYAMNMFFS